MSGTDTRDEGVYFCLCDSCALKGIIDNAFPSVHVIRGKSHNLAWTAWGVLKENP